MGRVRSKHDFKRTRRNTFKIILCDYMKILENRNSRYFPKETVFSYIF